MNKKSMFTLLMAAALGMGSCNEIQEFNVNFGDRTYVNDYEDLIEAVNNNSLSLKERFEALSQILKEGFADIRVDADANNSSLGILTQAIINMDGHLTEQLGNLNSTLFDGFKSVCTQVGAMGDKVVTAMDENGNLLRLQIDATGRLINSQFVTSTSDLIKAMQNNNDHLANNVGVIDCFLEAGFAQEATALAAIKQAIASLHSEVATGQISNQQAQTALREAIETQTTSLGTKLGAIDAANKEGLATLSQKNELVHTAISSLEEEMKAGKKSNEDVIKELKAAIADQTASMGTKLDAIETASKEGLANISQKNELIHLALASLEREMKSGNTTLAQKLEDIETASKEGLTTVAQKNDLINQAIASLESEVKAGNKSNEEAFKEFKQAIADQTTSLETKLGAIETASKEGLATLSQKSELIGQAVTLLSEEVKAGNKSTEEAMKELRSAITAQTATLADKVSLVEAAVTTGFAGNKATMDSMTSDIKTALRDLQEEVKNGNTGTASYLTDLVNGVTAVNTALDNVHTQLDNVHTQLGTANTTLDAMKDLMVKDLADNGVTINSDGKSIFVIPEVWHAIETAGINSALYTTFKDAIKEMTVPTVSTPIQVTPGTSWHRCARFTQLPYDESTVGLRAVTINPEVEANGKTVIRIIKSPIEVSFKMTGLWSADLKSQYCTYPYVYCIRVFDARGDYQVFGGSDGKKVGPRADIGEETALAVPTTLVKETTVVLKCYHNGRMQEDVKAYVFTYNQSSTLPELFWPSTAPQK
ncbi:MAG: hypothetical protein KBT12_03085 [Bacteroidales bacterium]|nr:hypothetical protein [Candidatus Physcousia equi]